MCINQPEWPRLGLRDGDFISVDTVNTQELSKPVLSEVRLTTLSWKRRWVGDIEQLNLVESEDGGWSSDSTGYFRPDGSETYTQEPSSHDSICDS